MTRFDPAPRDLEVDLQDLLSPALDADALAKRVEAALAQANASTSEAPARRVRRRSRAAAIVAAVTLSGLGAYWLLRDTWVADKPSTTRATTLPELLDRLAAEDRATLQSAHDELETRGPACADELLDALRARLAGSTSVDLGSARGLEALVNFAPAPRTQLAELWQLLVPSVLRRPGGAALPRALDAMTGLEIQRRLDDTSSREAPFPERQIKEWLFAAADRERLESALLRVLELRDLHLRGADAPVDAASPAAWQRWVDAPSASPPLRSLRKRLLIERMHRATRDTRARFAPLLEALRVSAPVPRSDAAAWRRFVRTPAARVLALDARRAPQRRKDRRPR